MSNETHGKPAGGDLGPNSLKYHHVLCNWWQRPREGCALCERLYAQDADRAASALLAEYVGPCGVCGQKFPLTEREAHERACGKANSRTRTCVRCGVDLGEFYARLPDSPRCHRCAGEEVGRRSVVDAIAGGSLAPIPLSVERREERRLEEFRRRTIDLIADDESDLISDERFAAPPLEIAWEGEFVEAGVMDAARALVRLIASLDPVRPVAKVQQSPEFAELARILGEAVERAIAGREG